METECGPLQERVQALEIRVRLQQTLLVTVGCIGILVMTVAASSTKSENLKARGLALVDDAGRVRCEFKMSSGHPSLRFYDVDGQERASLGTLGLDLDSADAQVTISALGHEPKLQMTSSRDGQMDTVDLRVHPGDGASLNLSGIALVEGRRVSGSRIRLSRNMGTRAELAVTGDGSPVLRLYDEDGAERLRAYWSSLLNRSGIELLAPGGSPLFEAK
ncbi:MAG: hypothetical protein ABFS86_07025 [Planctomycetota bacterium]